MPDIKKVLEEAEWGRSIAFAKKPNVSFLKPNSISTVDDKTGELRDISDVTPMALANLALDLIGEEKVVDAMMSRIIMALRS